jgi:thiamine biosynthesis lipoprotein ApbE
MIKLAFAFILLIFSFSISSCQITTKATNSSVKENNVDTTSYHVFIGIERYKRDEFIKVYEKNKIALAKIRVKSSVTEENSEIEIELNQAQIDSLNSFSVNLQHKVD